MYEQFDTLNEVDSRIRNRIFHDFIINNEVGMSTSFNNGNKKYIMKTKEAETPVLNYCREFRTISEVNSITEDEKNTLWYRLFIKNTGTFILLWGVKIRE